jgi:undecaprenyldiphospho-muramoylpentapeptide beta-N-acetylglucosaminyltransferase
MSLRQPTIVLAAGGTGGHVFPAEALADALTARGIEPVLFTDRRGRSFRGVKRVQPIAGGGIAGLGWAARTRSVVALGYGLCQALWRLRREAPRAAIGFGGYASLPTMLAATLLGIPTVVHEQNAILGRANRLLAGRVGRIAVSFARMGAIPAGAEAKVTRVGMPVRPAFAGVQTVAYQPPLAHAPIRLLVLGGSQGAQVFSTLIPDAIGRLDPQLRGRLQISQQCRPETLEATRAAYLDLAVDAELATFFEDVPFRMADAQLVIARSGASTVAELTAVGRPAILVPYPHATDDHQTANARAIEAAAGGWMLEQKSLTAEALAARLASLLTAPDELAAAAARAREAGTPDAADRLADLVFSMIPVAGGCAAANLPRQGAA